MSILERLTRPTREPAGPSVTEAEWQSLIRRLEPPQERPPLRCVWGPDPDRPERLVSGWREQS